MNISTVSIPVTIAGKDSKGYTAIIDEATISFKVGWDKPEEQAEVVDSVLDMLRTDKVKVTTMGMVTPIKQYNHLENAKHHLQGYFTHTEDPIDSRTNFLESAVREIINHLEENQK